MFKILFKPSAQREFEALPRDVQERLGKKIDNLALAPWPPGAKKLHGEEAWRVRVGDYRIVYEIRGQELIVLVLRIAHRREAYR
jgi:mRNA interferase RelE/StbE